jgi:hypothetical protein
MTGQWPDNGRAMAGQWPDNDRAMAGQWPGFSDPTAWPV